MTPILSPWKNRFSNLQRWIQILTKLVFFSLDPVTKHN